MRPDRVLLVHGWWAGGWVWSRFEAVFRARGFETTAVDLPLPAPGRSIGGTRFADHLRVVLSAADALGGPIVVGHSAGGLLAQKLVETRALPACVCLAPAPSRESLPIVSRGLLRLALRHSPAMLASRPFRPSDAVLRRIALNRLPVAEQDAVLARLVPAPGRQGLEIGLLGVPVRPERVTTPMLLVGAAHDRLIPARVVRKAAARLGAEHREYGDHAHHLVGEPGCEAVAADTSDWIERVVAA